jgi:hypothetical protein
MPSDCENQPPNVAGNKIIEEAKIGGITPAILILSPRVNWRLFFLSYCWQ